MSSRITGAEYATTTRRTDDDKVISLERVRAGDIGVAHPLVRIHLVGLMRATTYLGNDILPRGRQARAILATLCLAAGAQLHRARLASVLWDRVPDAQARKSLRQSLRELVSAMGPLADELVSFDRETLRINSNLCWIDVT